MEKYFLLNPKINCYFKSLIYIPGKNENFQVLLSKMKEELLSVRHKNLKNIEKINISFILTKMSLVNSGLCKIF